MRKPRVAIVGGSVAGTILAHLLKDSPDVDVVCLEQAFEGEGAAAGTALNIGPNAAKTLLHHAPDLHDRLAAASAPWNRWSISMTDGTPLMDLELAEVADCPGMRIAWDEFSGILTNATAPAVRYATQVTDVTLCDRAARVGIDAGGVRQKIDADLVIGADGRHSRLREHHFGYDAPTHLGVILYRILLDAAPGAALVDDYAQWFNATNRLLAFAVPGGKVYCAGSFPVAPGDPAPEHMKCPDRLAALYTGPGGLDPACRFLVDGITANIDRLHWIRVQEAPIRYAHSTRRLLLLGDAAHPMVPTLGQSTSMAIEDACVAADAIKGAAASGAPLSCVPDFVERRRRPRVAFAMALSNRASDTILADGDPVAGARWKNDLAFRRELSRLYRDAPVRSGWLSDALV